MRVSTPVRFFPGTLGYYNKAPFCLLNYLLDVGSTIKPPAFGNIHLRSKPHFPYFYILIPEDTPDFPRNSLTMLSQHRVGEQELGFLSCWHSSWMHMGA